MYSNMVLRLSVSFTSKMNVSRCLCSQNQFKNRRKIIRLSYENEFARDFMNTNKNYLPQPVNVKSLPSTKSINKQLLLKFNVLVELSKQNATIPIDDFIDTLNQLTASCAQFNADELMKVLRLVAIIQYPKILQTNSFNALREALSATCQSSCHNWDINTLSSFGSIWNRIPYGNTTLFIQTACDLFVKNAELLSPPQLVQALYHLKYRNVSDRNITTFENQLEKHCDQLTLEEISIATMVFVRTGIRLKNSALVTNIYEKLLTTDLSNVASIAIISLIKILRLSHDSAHLQLASKLLEAIYNNQNIFFSDISAVTHIVLFAAEFGIRHHNLLEAIAYYFLENLNQARLKDMGIISHAFVHLDVHTKSKIEMKLFENILNELPNRTIEHEDHRPTFIACMCNLAINNYYNTDLINSALATVEIDLNSRAQSFHYGNLLFLNSYAHINLGANEYTGALLSDELRRLMAKEHNNNNDITILSNIGQTIQEMYGHYKIARALPHFKRDDIFVIIDVKKKCAVNKFKLFPTNQSGCYFNRETLTENNKHLEVIAVIIAGQQHYINQEQLLELSGTFKFKIKQLTLLGFHPIVIPHFDWQLKTRGQRKQYISEKFLNILQNTSDKL